MLTRLGDARTILARSLRRTTPCLARKYATRKTKDYSSDVAKYPIAKELFDTGVFWKPSGGARRASALSAQDHRRVNIVNKALCGTLAAVLALR